ncbi:MerR family transcriptional regulator [Paenibacillus solisilvae]|uniref:Chromosome-anchoring protein RacA n=1 Tax=Paenibacillus solisilvae TaxID=2486751 RepID=A0ABW0W4L6_9BACL
MSLLKTRDAADLLGVSQTTIKRWASTFPDFFQKDRAGHYIFSEQEIGLLIHIKDRIDHGETLDHIALASSSQTPETSAEKPEALVSAVPMEDMLSRIELVERSLDHKADEVVSMQLLQHREELEELRHMIEQLAASMETMYVPGNRSISAQDEIHPLAAAKLQAPPKKRGLLRSFFSLL